MANKTINTNGGSYNTGTINAKTFVGRDNFNIVNNYGLTSNEPKLEDNLANLSSQVINSLQQKDYKTVEKLLNNTSENLKKNPNYKILCAIAYLAHKDLSDLNLSLIRKVINMLEAGLQYEETRVISLVIFGIINYDFYRKNGLTEVSPTITTINAELSHINWLNRSDIKTLLDLLHISQAARWNLKLG